MQLYIFMLPDRIIDLASITTRVLIILLEKLKEMFANMVLLKDAALIPHYYHEDFLLYTNRQEQNYEEFLTSHIEYYASSKEYSIVYDDESFLENQDKVAGRVWITVTIPREWKLF